VLQQIAQTEGKTTNQIIAELFDEATMNQPDETPRNFASVLRVSCCRYLAVHGDSVRRPGVPAHAAVELRSIK
jgi:predicted DNA-binding ribbon-helix-helix protein